MNATRISSGEPVDACGSAPWLCSHSNSFSNRDFSKKPKCSRFACSVRCFQRVLRDRGIKRTFLEWLVYWPTPLTILPYNCTYGNTHVILYHGSISLHMYAYSHVKNVEKFD